MTTDIATAIATALHQLREERKTIDDRIAALELAHETLGGKVATPKARARGRDAGGADKVRAFLVERDKPTTTAQVSRAMRCSRLAAAGRLLKLVKLGQAVRLSRGVYAAHGHKGGAGSKGAGIKDQAT